MELATYRSLQSVERRRQVLALAWDPAGRAELLTLWEAVKDTNSRGAVSFALCKAFNHVRPEEGAVYDGILLAVEGPDAPPPKATPQVAASPPKSEAPAPPTKRPRLRAVEEAVRAGKLRLEGFDLQTGPWEGLTCEACGVTGTAWTTFGVTAEGSTLRPHRTCAACRAKERP